MINSLQQLPFSKELISLFKKYGTLYYFSAGEKLHYDSKTYIDTCFLLSGTVKLLIERDDRKALLYLLDCDQSCIINYMNLFNKVPIPFSSTFIEDSIVITIPIDKIINWSMNNPELKRFLIHSQKQHYTSILQCIRQNKE